MPCEAAQHSWWDKEPNFHPGAGLLPELTPPEKHQEKAKMSTVCIAISLAQVQIHL